MATIVTQATPTVTIGSPISDTATVTGGPSPAPTPTGTVTFTLYGPNDATCAGPVIFTSSARPLGGGPPPTATSAPFTPTAPGTYRWIAAYSGDANYPGVTSACNDANESSIVNQSVATIVTSATPDGAPRQPHLRHRHRHRRRGPGAHAHRHRHLHPLRPERPHVRRCPSIFTSAARARSAGGPPPTANSGNLHPHRRRHLQLGRRLQR